ncbi:putative P-loop containing nucleoside triphosphate hydrolase, leucine-rich repeat domain, L [Rosa chinensis]|uniref:Putative P-loop containing nucleoside triphosphate hydrolase, leucine-rich repeat domain, L n=1 Tax=Rosa chinensis TaxID=74649 RepID=A0A2P6PAQ7_ROSCH|nr:disease resistance protein RPM1 [Rosa chinensis]PRQ19016.1 putative P-loop containing nucleoside triphosphate hydrolase, leucine-rich repeat domain, L [Rosa chinensis]
MAESAVTFLVDRLTTLLEEEVKLLSGIREQVEDLVDELERIKAFLRVADAKEDSNPQLKVWVKQVRDVAHEMEDALDKFRLFHSHDHGHGFQASLHKLSCIIKKWKAKHQISADIQRINSKVKNLYEGHERYKLVDQAGSNSARLVQHHKFDQGDALLLEEADLVAIGERKKQLIELLMKEDTGRQVVPIVGMGGLGKTTLVKQVYEDPKVQKRFKVHAWITVSQSFKTSQLLRHMINNIFKVIQKPVPEDEEVETMDNNQLRERIKKLLQNSRYLIVLDGIWHISDWDAINHVMPNNNRGSRVMLTTRYVNVASASCLGNHDMLYHLEPLSPEDSWTLFCKKTFHGESCPPNLEEICQSILMKCRGLPLAIVAISSVLALKDKRNVDEWAAVSGSIGAEIDGNDQLYNLKKFLYLSYSDLPYHLKSCFLYLSIFPDLYKIEHMKLIRLWLAEGFVIGKEGRTPEEAAESYLRELLDRSLIQAAETSTDGRVKSYRIHDLLREIVILKSKEQNFAAIEKDQGTMWPDEKVRRLSIVNTLQNIHQKRTPSRLRSLLVFGVEDSLTDFPIPKLFHTSLQLLTVLDLEGAHLEMFPIEVVKLLLLKYLSLRHTKVKQIPSSIKKLQNLETLDLKHSHVVELPAEILNLKRLRHLLVYRYEVESYARFNARKGVKIPAGISSLQSLQKLCFIEANQYSGALMAELGRMNQLRRLGIYKLREEHGATLCSSVQNMTSLRSLSVFSAEKEKIIDLSHISRAPPFLQRLYLAGRLENLPHWISSLQNLVRLFLKWSRLKEDPLVHLRGLPNLVHLELLQVYDGESLHFEAGGFPSLKLLGIDKLDELQSVTIEEGAMPCLEKLIIQRCKCLKKVPSGIEHLTNLKLLEFFDMPDELIMPLHPDGGEDHWKVAHVPAVYYSYWRGGGWDVYSLFNDVKSFNSGTSAVRRLEPNILGKV